MGLPLPPDTQRIIPALSYDDASTAIEFLCRAFGFAESSRLDMPDGTIGHAELTLHGNTIMLASAYPEGGLGGPRGLPRLHSFVTVYVDDVDAHYARAKAEGAEITEELADQFYGDRVYRALDLEGHRWSFHERIQEVSDAELQAALKGAGGA